MDPALCNEKGKGALKLGAVGEFDTSVLFLSHEIVQTIPDECLA